MTDSETPPHRYRFDRFTLDPADRRLFDGAAPVELSARYLDALALLVREAGTLVSKDRFMDEVWRGVPVTDEALTQGIRSLRRALGDDATNPRFIETVPKYGYRFVAAVTTGDAVVQEPAPVAPALPPMHPLRRALLLTGAGTIGAGLAGLVGGLLYGFIGAAQPLQPGMGAASVLLVLLCLTILVALLGGAGVSAGIAASGLLPGRAFRLSIAGGALGGLVVGAVAKLLGLDAFNLLLGRSPGDITGAGEGLVLGGAAGLGFWLAVRGAAPLARQVAIAGGIGAMAGLGITLAGGRLLGGSLDLLARGFPESRLRLDQVGALFGETGFGPAAQAVTGALEGGLFAAFVVGAILVARRGLGAG
ncbi:winged helix-turn-helix domain-containing protein [Sphingomonas sp.]|uniref:winged helix-turn-helix domain-containing protein n=1 Tax=Sphingomonas sp. TaxID=28214 RepID=UPI002DD6A299|nr:transcriptional regulator [Sphingomonas sp.]